jgi:hypothetical protein
MFPECNLNSAWSLSTVWEDPLSDVGRNSGAFKDVMPAPSTYAGDYTDKLGHRKMTGPFAIGQIIHDKDQFAGERVSMNKKTQNPMIGGRSTIPPAKGCQSYCHLAPLTRGASLKTKTPPAIFQLAIFLASPRDSAKPARASKLIPPTKK